MLNQETGRFDEKLGNSRENLERWRMQSWRMKTRDQPENEEKPLNPRGCVLFLFVLPRDEFCFCLYEGFSPLFIALRFFGAEDSSLFTKSKPLRTNLEDILLILKARSNRSTVSLRTFGLFRLWHVIVYKVSMEIIGLMYQGTSFHTFAVLCLRWRPQNKSFV